MVSLTHQQAQKTTVCPLCGAVPWREGLEKLVLSPANHVSLGKSHLVYLCPVCLAQLLAVAEGERWLCYLELYYKRQLEQPPVVKAKSANHGHDKGRKK